MNNPWSVQIEFTEGCNRRCHFCGIWSIRGEHDFTYKFMTPELIGQIATDLNEWMPKGRRIEIALQGEPLMNKNVVEMVDILRTNYPKCQILIASNGDVLKSKKRLIHELFDAGLNMLLIDIYDRDSTKILSILHDSGIPINNFYETKRTPYMYYGTSLQEIVIMDSISSHSGENRRRVLNNQAGNIKEEFAIGNPKLSIPRIPLELRCSNVFRELVIKYDGTACGCCMDWLRDLVIGKFPEQSLHDIWFSEKFNAVRQLLYNKRRIIAPCNRCNYRGFRNGLVNGFTPTDTSEDELLSIINGE